MQLGKDENERISVPLGFFFFLIPALAVKAGGFAAGDGFRSDAACAEVKSWYASSCLRLFHCTRPVHGAPKLV